MNAKAGYTMVPYKFTGVSVLHVAPSGAYSGGYPNIQSFGCKDRRRLFPCFGRNLLAFIGEFRGVFGPIYIVDLARNNGNGLVDCELPGQMVFLF